MREGSVFLIDEISLADDSVLERLNSVLEPERSLLLAERGSGEGEEQEIAVIKAQEAFRVVSTMNPGGDFGKKEVGILRHLFIQNKSKKKTNKKLQRVLIRGQNHICSFLILSFFALWSFIHMQFDLR